MVDLHVRDVRLKMEHLTDKDRDGIPDELANELAQTRELRQWAEQNEHAHSQAPLAKTIARAHERYLLDVIAATRAAPSAEPINVVADTEPPPASTGDAFEVDSSDGEEGDEG